MLWSLLVQITSAPVTYTPTPPSDGSVGFWTALIGSAVAATVTLGGALGAGIKYLVNVFERINDKNMAQFQAMENVRNEADRRREERELEREKLDREEKRRIMLIQVKTVKVITEVRKAVQSIEKAHEQNTNVMRQMAHSHDMLTHAVAEQKKGMELLSGAIDSLKAEVARKEDRKGIR